MSATTMDAKPKLLRINHLDFVKNEKVGHVPYRPLGDRVIVRVDEVKETSAGGVMLPFDVQERHNAASTTGVIVALGDAAFYWSFDRTRKWEGEKPVVGNRVLFDKYAGALVPGDDDNWYRIMDDKCIGCIEEETADVPDTTRLDVV